MPWILNEKGEFEYEEVKNGPQEELNPAEKKDLSFMQSFLYNFGITHKRLENFLRDEALKPITFDITKADGTKESKTLTGEETLSWLNGHQNVFKEAGREPNTHLLAFAIKNGITMDDIDLLQNNPTDTRCNAIRQNLEKSRKEMFELVGCDDKRVSENAQLNNTESKVAAFFGDYFEKVSGHFADIKNSDKTNAEKTLAFTRLFKEYQSLAVQSINIGAKLKQNSPYLDGNKIVPFVNEKLAGKGLIVNFDSISNVGRLSQMITQPAESITKLIDEKTYETNKEYYRSKAFIDNTKAAATIAYVSDNIWNSSQSPEEILSEANEAKISAFSDEVNFMPTYAPGFIDDQEKLQGQMRCEAIKDDLYLDEKLAKFSSQIVPHDFENELHSLADSFGNQSNPMDPGFNEMTKGLAKLSEVYKNPNKNKDLELTALRYAQQKASDYLDGHSKDFESNTPKPATLLAAKIFTLTGAQKIGVRADLEPGTVLKGNAEYKDHDLSLDSIKAFAPVKVKTKALNSRRYSTIMRKHANRDDVLKNAKEHIKKETSADYSKINKVTDRNNVVVHSGLGKKNKEAGGYNLEFVCAGSSNIQLAKTYKGQTGRNEIGKVSLQDDPAALEIVNTVKQKYNIDFETPKTGDNTKYEFALEQEYGKPMYLDNNKSLHSEEAPDSRLMPGIRKLENGNTTRFNISGAMGKAFGFIGAAGFSNSGDYSIDNNKDYMIKLADEWLTNVYEEYESKILEGKQSELKPINIMFKGHSRGGVAANEASLMVNHLIEHKYPSLRDYVHISTQLLDPVPGYGSNLKHPEVDLTKGDYNHRGREMRGLKASAAEKKNNSATVFYGIHSNNAVGFAPQNINGADRLILSGMSHDTGIFDAVDGHKRGYLAENGEEYRGSGLNELENGLYFIDEDKNIVSCKNSQEAHKAVDAMLGKHVKRTTQRSRHNQIHDMVDTWFKSHAEVITPKDTRYPVEQAMQADRNALKGVLNSFDYTKPETELAANPNDILQRGISSMFAHQALMDQFKTNKKRVYPETVADTKKLLAASEKSGLADKIRNSADFKLFYDGLSKEDIKALVSGNQTKLRSYFNNYKAIANLSPEAKLQVRNENLVRHRDNQVGRKEMFFAKHINAKGEWDPHIPNRVNLSAGRTALNMIAVSRLMQKGNSLQDIMDPFKLERERQAMGEEVLRDYATLTDSELAEKASKDILYGFEHSLDEMDAVVGKLDNLSVEELSKPENAYIVRCRDLITNFGQELGSKGQPVFDNAVKNSSAAHIENLFKRQVTSNLVMGRIEEAQTMVNNMVNHPETFTNADEALTNVGGAVFTVMAMGTKFKDLKESKGKDFKFSEAFGDIPSTVVEACKATMQGTEFYQKIKENIAQKKNPDAADPAKIQKLGKEFQSGKLFEGKFKLEEGGMGFKPIDDIDAVLKKFNKQPAVKALEKDEKALGIYNNARHNIDNYVKREKLGSKLADMKERSINEISSAGKGLGKLSEEGTNLSDKEFNAQKKSLMDKLYGGIAGMVYCGIVNENCKKNGEYDINSLTSSLDPTTVDVQKKSIAENIEKLVGKESLGNILSEVKQATTAGNLSQWYMDKINNPSPEPSINKENLKAENDGMHI